MSGCGSVKISLDDFPFSKLFLFKGVEDKLLQRWLNLCHIKSFLKSDVLLEPDSSNDKMYIILQGQVSIHLATPNNPVLAVIKIGECVGEMSLFDEEPPSAYVIAQCDTKTLCIDKMTLLTMIDDSHRVCKNLLYLLTRRLRTDNEVVLSSQQLQKKYELHANVDALTGLYNRRWLDDYFKRLINRQNPVDKTSVLSLMMIDVDNFKQFNDRYGHSAGDSALKCVSSALQQYIRPTDIATRYGGEEFLVLLPDASLLDAKEVAERVRLGIETFAIEHDEDIYPSITISVGLALYEDSDSQGGLIAAADEALYRAKKQGRNQVCVNYRTS